MGAHPYDNPIWFVWRFTEGLRKPAPWIFNNADLLTGTLAAWRADGVWFEVQLVRKGALE